MSEPPGAVRVLLVEDDPRAAMLIGELLRSAWSGPLVITHAQRLADTTAELGDERLVCALLALPTADEETLGLLEHVRGAAPDLPVIVISDDPGEQLDVAAVRAGAQDVLRRDTLNPAVLARAMRLAVERKRSESELAHRALHDPLTGLPNRVLFIDRLTVALERTRRHSAPVAVMFADVDGFKRINDSMGHATGDRLLTVLAHRFREMLRPMDTVARFGGDEFLFAFEQLESEREAVLIAERIRHSASQPLTLSDGEASITVSVGIVVLSDPTDPAVTPESAIRDADTAMYRAKGRGGARCELFDGTSQDSPSRRGELEAGLRDALQSSQLRVHYLPRVSLNGETGLTGFEALVRWQHPELGLIEAGQFVAVAESSGLIVPIGQWVLEQALRDVSAWRSTRPEVKVSVNISARQLEDPGLVPALAAAITASGADPGAVSLEINEDAVQHNPRVAARTLDAIRQLGVEVAIDDFGTGHSSLAELTKLPLDTIKIDRSFVSALGPDVGSEPGTEGSQGAGS